MTLQTATFQAFFQSSPPPLEKAIFWPRGGLLKPFGGNKLRHSTPTCPPPYTLQEIWGRLLQGRNAPCKYKEINDLRY